MSKTFAQKIMNSKNNEDTVLLECPHCQYWWEYTGDLERATCPSCSGKVKVDEDAMDSENEN